MKAIIEISKIKQNKHVNLPLVDVYSKVRMGQRDQT